MFITTLYFVFTGSVASDEPGVESRGAGVQDEGGHHAAAEPAQGPDSRHTEREHAECRPEVHHWI